MYGNYCTININYASHKEKKYNEKPRNVFIHSGSSKRKVWVWKEDILDVCQIPGSILVGHPTVCESLIF